MIARCDAHARAVHHSGPAAIETIHKDSGRTLRCIVLAFPALPNMLTHDCSPGSFCCSALLLASLRRSIINELSSSGRRHSQQGCWGGPYAACGGSPVPGGELRLVRSPPQVVMQPRCVGRKRVARAWAAQARCGRMPRGGSSAQEALLKASGGRGSVRARRCSLA